ncbi:acid protease [Fomes fomentarius]|nr:acid protease [Fomes fomentarius]
MKPSPLALPLFLLYASDLVGAARHELARRADIVGNTSVSNVGDVEYLTDIKLGGQNFSVQIDTGSSDLWVVGNVPNAKNTGKTAGVTYAVGQVQGPVLEATLEFAGYTVNDQVYISVSESSENREGSGLIGLGPNYGSQVSDAIGDRSGDAVLDRIFLQNTSTPNYITFLLGRNNDPTDPPAGQFTVGELVPGYEAVTSQPKLPVSILSSNDNVNQHWQVLLDADGITGPAGEDVIDKYDIETGVKSTSNKKQLTVVIDTGFSLPQVPPDVATAFYKDVPDAKFVSLAGVGKIWQIPCDKEVNVTFKFAGVKFPIHPLDANIDLNMTDSHGNHVCYGAFQPMAAQDDATYDVIFGMAFLRNAYTYINFGDFVEGSTAQKSDPYVQMLPITNDTAEAHSDFDKVRGDSPWDPSDDLETLTERIRSHLGLVIGLAVAAALLIIAGIVGMCVHRRHQQRAAGAPGFFQKPYQPLHEPAPEAYGMQPVYGQSGYQNGPPNQNQNNAYHPSYSSPWDARY